VSLPSLVAPDLRVVVARRALSTRRHVHARHRTAALMLVRSAIKPGGEAFLAGVAVIVPVCTSPARPRFLFPIEPRTTVPPSCTHVHRCTGSVEPFRRVGLASVPKAPFLWVARVLWCRLVIERSGFPRARRSCACRRGRAGRQADTDACTCVHEPAPRRTPTCARARASARTFLHRAAGILTCAASRART
jgi:hypothetical protein